MNQWRLWAGIRAKMGACHQFPLLQSILKSACRRKEIGWLSPFFVSSDFHHRLLARGLTNRGSRLTVPRSRLTNRAAAFHAKLAAQH